MYIQMAAWQLLDQDLHLQSKIGYTNQECVDNALVSPLVSREKSFMEIRNVMALIELIGQKSRSE